RCMTDLTLLLQSASRGESQAAEKLLPLVYDELRRLAASRMAQQAAGQTLQATALVHEAWLRLGQDPGQVWNSRGHFFSAASEAMRRILIDRARKKASLKRGGDLVRVELDDLQLAETTPDEKLLLIDEVLAELKAVNPERAAVVVRKFFGGLTNKETAESLDISERAVNRHWECAKAWLYLKMRAAM
ncbi:MAG TPA: ECF-type sigma factor, partial [Verrucomicrobiae bacterium]